MKNLKRILTAGTFGAIAASVTPAPAAAYQIDCAILLCLAGGFPASAECTAAKAEMIRRITPYPIEPPLQLWRCPMGLSADVAQAIGMAAVTLGPDGLTDEVRQYRDAIELYEVKYTRHRSSDDVWWSDNTRAGDYQDANGEFSGRVGATLMAPIGWLKQSAATGSPSTDTMKGGTGVRSLATETTLSARSVLSPCGSRIGKETTTPR